MSARKKDMADFLLLVCIALIVTVIDIPHFNGGADIDRGRSLFVGNKKILITDIMSGKAYEEGVFKTGSDAFSPCDFSPPQAILWFKPFDLNRADPESLTFIRGIGPKLAEKIIARREEIGGFSKVDDLLKVRGIGPSKLKALKESMIVCR